MIDRIFEGIYTAFLVCLLIAFLAGIAAATLLPRLWLWVKPLIHGWTA